MSPGPNVVKTVTHEVVTSEELGGANTHATKSGVTHFACANEIEAIQNMKEIAELYAAELRRYRAGDSLRTIKNELRTELNTLNARKHLAQPYDIREVIDAYN